jgi:hypothetical protein
MVQPSFNQKCLAWVFLYQMTHEIQITDEWESDLRDTISKPGMCQFMNANIDETAIASHKSYENPLTKNLKSMKIKLTWRYKSDVGVFLSRRLKWAHKSTSGMTYHAAIREGRWKHEKVIYSPFVLA